MSVNPVQQRLGPRLADADQSKDIPLSCVGVWRGLAVQAGVHITQTVALPLTGFTGRAGAVQGSQGGNAVHAEDTP